MSRTFRNTATDSNLWEKHYWNFYRSPSTLSHDEQDQLLLARRTANRHNAMRAWADLTLTTGPRKSLGPLLVKTSGGHRWYEPLFAGSLLLTEMNVLKPGRLRELANRYGEGGPVDPQEATDQIISQLIRESGKSPTAEQRKEAEVKRAQRREMEKMSRESSPPSYPAFLQLGEEARPPTPLDFHSLFTKRIKEDDRLLLALRKLVSLDCGLVDQLLPLAEEFGDGARDILAALCADQHLTEDSISQFAHSAGAGSSEKIKDWPRALDVHERAAKGEPQLRLGHCLALHSIAEQLLTHLQRREAVTLIQQLHTRFKSPPPRSQPLKHRVLDCSEGVEEALISMSLFRYADSGEVSEYVDLLALHVWADIQARTRYDENFIEILNRAPSGVENQEAPPGSTRLLMKRITLSLRHLGFSVAYVSGKEEGDFDDFFLNTSLYCPAQRSTSPLICTAILCSVARRLGVAATLVSAKRHAMALILETGPEPPGWTAAPRTVGPWTGQGKDWSRFYYTAAYEGQWVAYEAGQYASYCAAAGTGKQRPNTEPATPVEVMLRLAEDMRGNVHSKLPVGFKHGGLEGGFEDDAAVMSRACTRELREYLLGKRSTPPSPLLAPFKPSSLIHLPPTSAAAPRAKSPHLKPLTAYASWLAIRILDPTKSKSDEDVLLTPQNQNQTTSPTIIIPLHPTMPSTPSQRINTILSGLIASDPTLRCDVTLLLQVNGADVKRELEVARSVGASKGKPKRGWEGGSKRAPVEVRKWVAAVLEEDAKPAGAGGGGIEVYGVGGGAKGMVDRVKRKELLDPSHPRNVEVELRVGSVVRHRVRGWKGVVVGWDSVCQMDGMELLVEGVVSRARRQGVGWVLHWRAYAYTSSSP